MLQAAPFICGIQVQANLVAGQFVACDFTALGKPASGALVLMGPAPCLIEALTTGHGGLTDVMATTSGTFSLLVY